MTILDDQGNKLYDDNGYEFRLSCPFGPENLHVCDTSWLQFVGCCTINPCKFGYGTCPQEYLQPVALDTNTDDLAGLSCQSNDLEIQFHECESGPDLHMRFFGCSDNVTCDNIEYSNGTMGAMVLDQERWQMMRDPAGAPGEEEDGGWNVQSNGPTTLLGFGPVLGMSLAVLLLVVSSVLFLACRKWKSQSASQTVPKEAPKRPRYSALPLKTFNDTLDHQTSAIKSSESHYQEKVNDWHPAPRTLSQKNLAWVMTWIWEVLVTLTPTLFLVLAILAIQLEGQSQSPYGERIAGLIQLSPTVYPIVFAAVAGRFFKNLARWHAEQRHGIKLGMLEQIFGSQSFAGSFERLLFVRSHLPSGLAILLVWAMSPLGGQSASRILLLGEDRVSSMGTVLYADPTYQFSRYYISSMVARIETNIQALYTLNLMAPPEQRQSPRDFWGFPRIPQWPENMVADEEYDIDVDALTQGKEYYSSLLGIKLQGLNLGEDAARYDFSLRTSYIQIDCSEPNHVRPGKKDPGHNASIWDAVDLSSWVNNLGKSFTVNITTSQPWTAEDRSRGHKAPTFHMVFATLDTRLRTRPSGSEYEAVRFFAFSCAMKTVYLETDMTCPSSSTCRAVRQRRVNQGRKKQFPDMMQDHLGGLIASVRYWEDAGGSVNALTASATENLIAGEDYLYGAQPRYDWRGVNVQEFSRRLTIAYNTFLDATKGPLEYSNIDMKKRRLSTPDTVQDKLYLIQTLYNETRAEARADNVYTADRLWIAILLTSTMLLQALAILGVVLLVFIKSPDVLGFTSSMTRDNPYVNLPAVGSALDGAERARMLGDLRVHLADVRPRDEVGYIAFQPVPSCGHLEPERLRSHTQVQKQDEDETEVSEISTNENDETLKRQWSFAPGWRPIDLRRLYR